MKDNLKHRVAGPMVGLCIFGLYFLIAGLLQAGGPPDSVKAGFALIGLIIPVALFLIYLKLDLSYGAPLFIQVYY